MNCLSPSILAADFGRLAEEVQTVDEAGAQYIHIDVMDGMFVPSITVGIPVVRDLRQCTDRILDVHLMVEAPERYVPQFADAGADLIISGAGVPTDLPRMVGDRQVKLAPIVSTEKAARVVLRYWDKKYKRMPDLLVVEGPLAGGHLGFTREQLDQFVEPGQAASEEISPAYEEEIRAIFKTVLSFEEKYETRIPVALAGGIDNRERARKAFDLGADAIQVASRFVTTEECDADIRYKEAYIRAGKEDIVIVKSPVGMPGRAIRNRFMERVMGGEKIPHSPCHRCLHTCNPAEIPYCITDALVSAAKGDVENALLFCGAGAWKADRIETVREVIQSLFIGS